jgi:hypothetical protein
MQLGPITEFPSALNQFRNLFALHESPELELVRAIRK